MWKKVEGCFSATRARRRCSLLGLGRLAVARVAAGGAELHLDLGHLGLVVGVHGLAPRGPLEDAASRAPVADAEGSRRSVALGGLGGLGKACKREGKRGFWEAAGRGGGVRWRRGARERGARGGGGPRGAARGKEGGAGRTGHAPRRLAPVKDASATAPAPKAALAAAMMAPYLPAMPGTTEVVSVAPSPRA